MAAKKKRVVLNMQQRLDVLKDKENSTMSDFQIGKKYGVNTKTIQRIKKNAAKINEFADKDKREKKRQIIRDPVYDDLDVQLFAWFTEQRILHNHLTDALMLEKAKELKEALPTCSQARISRGWLTKFKKRHGIRLVNIFGEKGSGDKNDASKFITKFLQLLDEENIDLRNVYNMDESGLVWNALPTKTLAREEENNVSGYKIYKDRITVAFSANALGTHKLMPLVIYKYTNPRALKHETTLPVIFKSQANAWMTRQIFADWFNNHFKPSVKEYQKENEISGKVILLVDNCKAHKISSELENDEFKIMYLPLNTTSLIQPMDQGIIEKTKRVFRYKLLKRVITYENGVNDFYKDYTIKNCIDILSSSWAQITQRNIRNAWNKIIESNIPCDGIITSELEPDWEELISNVTGEKCVQQQVVQFLSICDEADNCNEEEEIVDGTATEEEPFQQLHDMTSDVAINETARNELRTIFDRLMFYANRAPEYVQYMVQAVRLFFLGRDN